MWPVHSIPRCTLFSDDASSRHFGAGTGQIWLDNVKCAGTDMDVAQCKHSDWGKHNCDHGEDAGVICRSGGSVGKHHHELYCRLNWLHWDETRHEIALQGTPTIAVTFSS